MVRLLGVEIPENKKIEYALRYIQGIGPARAAIIIAEAGISPDMRARELSEEQLNSVATVIADKGWVVEGDLRREVAANIKRLKAIQCHRGLRHIRGLPVRGQRTKTNARTRKGNRR